MRGGKRVKKIWFLFCLLFILSSCAQPQSEQTGNNDKAVIPVEKDIHTSVTEKMHIDSETFHFVGDWLSNTEIVYVERKDDQYSVELFNLTSGESKVIYKDPAIIVDVLVHPMKNMLLLHTTNSSNAAQIKMIALDGTILNEFSIASSEVEIQWNDSNPDLVLLTAFQEDWTFNNYMYNGEKDELSSISLPDPFPKWLGVDTIVAVDNEDQLPTGGEVVLFDVETEHIESSGNLNVVYINTYEDRLLLVQNVGEGNEEYSLIHSNGEVLNTWLMPETNDGMFPKMNWLSNEVILMTRFSYEEQPDQLKESFELISFEQGEEKLIAENLEAASFSCSPDATKCLTGYGFEKILDLNTEEVEDWLLFNE